MKERQFTQLSSEHFGRVLGSHGFSDDHSRHSTFHKQVSADIYHFITPCLSRDGTWYDILVFANSPLIEPQFSEQFPDRLSIPSDSFSSLHPKFGVGARMHEYWCRTEEGFIRNFNKHAIPALTDKALDYLSGINSLDDMIPYIKRDFYLGAALWHTGNKHEAKTLLKAEEERLKKIDDSTGRIAVLLSYIDRVLKAS